MGELEFYAPVMIPTLCRFEHFKRCVESLKECEGADKTELYIGVDYPLNESHREGHERILNYLKDGITGFQDVHVFIHDKNLGAIGNWYFLYEEIRKNSDCYIASEDDNYFSPNFLLFINEGMSKFKYDDNVFSISGYGYPIKEFKDIDTYYLYPAYSAWGVGMWFEKNERIRGLIDNLDYSKSILGSIKKSYKLLRMNPHALTSLINMVSKNKINGDTIYESYLSLERINSLFPTLSKVRNYGHDGSGIHCATGNSNVFINQPIDTSKKVCYDTKVYDEKKFIRVLYKYKKEMGGGIIRIIVKYILYRCHLLSCS